MKKNNKGFSLIELSIVLIIMGLLVAGITGGAALIKSAQLRSVITESNNQRSGYNTYYGQNDAVPGGIDEALTIKSSQEAWDALRIENILDKEATGGFLPSKFKRTYWFLNTQADSANSFAKSNVMVACGKASSGEEKAAVETIFDGKDVVSLLTKMDNGEGDSGSVYALTADSNGETLLNASGVATPDADKKYILMMKMDF